MKAWLFTIMRNTFINSYHKAQRAKTYIDTSENEFVINSFTSFHASPESNYAYKELGNAMKKLEPELKTPIEMYFTGFKYREIADEIEIPIGTVKNRIFLARKKLADILKDYNEVV
jgi:RNA polymerase sigma-70 factor (ECF subfamily)